MSRDAAVSVAEAAPIHLRHLQQADLAATLRAGLKRGDACPVCAQSIATLPKTDAATIAAFKRAEADAKTADKQRLGAERGYASAKTKCAAARERLSTAEAALPGPASRKSR